MDADKKQYFVDLLGKLPRCGPGSIETTRKAFYTMRNVPPNPKILDIGVGTGMSTIELAKLSGGSIIAIDIKKEFLDKLKEKIEIEGLKTITPRLMNMD